MASLQWIGKEAVVGHHREVPYHLLRGDPALSVGEDGGVGSGNLLVQGDNLLALKALLPYYAGRVKCIYIDPPYNTGNEGWVYNDNVNSPEIRQWLGKVVGKEGETLDRHDRWLCMMYPRLALLREFLTEDGAIFVSIDDNEVQNLRGVMDEVFGRKNFVATVVWHKMDSPKNSAIHLSEDHEYMVIYAKDGNVWRPHPVPRNEAMIARYKNPDNDPRGPWLLSDLAARNFYAAGRYPITTPSGKVIPGPPAGSYWRFSRERFDELAADNRIYWGKGGNNRPGFKRFLSEVKDGVVPQTLWPWQEVGSTRNSKQELSQLMALGPGQDLFITPKPSQLIQRVAQIAADKDSLIMDSFAGSGTTGHAVLAMNKADGGNRRFICIEMDPTIATTITAQRLKKVVEGYHPGGDMKKEKVEGTGGAGGFRYVTLGEPIFNERGQVRAEVRFADLAAHVFFTETGEPLPKKVNGKRSPLIGVCRGTAYYLLFNGTLGDKRPDGGNVLTGNVLAELPKHEGPRVVFGEACRLGSARLKREGVTFRQIPYQIKVS
ncbi:MAG: site-specific DNA-methyltransferase [Phycisphaerales bacterium]|nr:site-specific DNA-methyltransferase [Phycisphaerales bacterium]